MPKLHLTRILQDLVKEHGADTLLDQIRKAKSDPDAQVPDPRTFGRILREETFPQPRHLLAFDDFLKEKGRGLDTINLFDPAGLLSSIVELGRISFRVPSLVQGASKMNGEREYVSSWDLSAVTKISDSIRRERSLVEIALRTEPPREPQVDPAKIDWTKHLDDDKGTYCSVGSPLVNGLSSYMLGEMFAVDKPFSPPARGANSLPFYFSWYPSLDHVDREPYPSAFALAPSDLQALQGNAVSDEFVKAINEKRAQAFVHDNKTYEVWLDREPHDQYGVVVVQRRKRDVIWMVCAGLSGPGTAACADILPDIKLTLPEWVPGENAPVVYAVVQSVVDKDRDKAFGDTRKVTQSMFLLPTPAIWQV